MQSGGSTKPLVRRSLGCPSAMRAGTKKQQPNNYTGMVRGLVCAAEVCQTRYVEAAECQSKPLAGRNAVSCHC